MQQRDNLKNKTTKYRTINSQLCRHYSQQTVEEQLTHVGVPSSELGFKSTHLCSKNIFADQQHCWQLPWNYPAQASCPHAWHP